MNTMKTNQIPEIYDLAEKHAKRHSEQRDTAWKSIPEDQYDWNNLDHIRAVHARTNSVIYLRPSKDLRNEISNLEHDYAIVSAERNNLREHAQRLAEALRELREAAIRNGLESELANQAIAAWEAAQ